MIVQIVKPVNYVTFIQMQIIIDAVLSNEKYSLLNALILYSVNACMTYSLVTITSI